MKSSDNRKVALLVLAAVSLSFIGLAGPAAGAQTLDITGLRISPNPGYACENTTISFNVTNNLGTMVDLITVSVTAKSAIGGMDWQSNITMLGDGATSQQSFTWSYPPEGTYDISITVMGAGQFAQKSGRYAVLPCAAHVYIGSVTVVKSAQAPSDGATLMVDVMNDGHAAAYNTTIAVQATGPHPDRARYFLGSTVIPVIAENGTGRPEFTWTPVPAPGVYNVTVITVDETGVMASKDVGLVVDLQGANTVRVTSITVEPWPPMQGRESIVTAALVFHGNWTGVPVAVKAFADGPASYPLLNITLREVMVDSLITVNFSWPGTIEPGEYDLTVTASMFNPKEYTISKVTVTQMARQKQWSPANFKLDIKGLRVSPYPPLPGQDTTVTVELANAGDADAPPAKLTVTADGPAFYNLGTRTTPNTSFGSVVRMEFNWTQPIVPGEYAITAFLEDAGGNQSLLRKTYPVPHVLESNLSIVNGNTTYNYFYYGTAPNGSQGQNITVIVPATLNETAAAATGLNDPTTGAVVGIAVGSVVSIASMAAYGLVRRRGQLSALQSNPMYKESGNAGQNPMYQDKAMAGENPLYIHERMVHGVHSGEGVAEPREAALVGGGLPGGAVISSAVSSGIRESPSRPSTGQTAVSESPTKASEGRASIRESPTLASTGVKTPRDAASGQATGRRQYEPRTVTDEDGDIGSDARMAINEKGLPGRKKPSAQRLAGGGTEPTDDDSDDDGVPEIQGMAINEKGLPGEKGTKGTKGATHRVAGGGTEPVGDLDGDGSPEALSKKGYDYYQAKGDLSSAGRLRESPTRATTASTRDSVSSVAQAAGGGDDMPTESLDQARKGWDGTIKGITPDEGVSGLETVKHPSMPEVPDLMSDLSGGDQPDTKRTFAAPHVFEQKGSVAQGIRESPTRAPTGEAAFRESPTLPSSDYLSQGTTTGREAAHPVISKVRESPTLPSRDQASGQATGKRQSEPAAADVDRDGMPDLRAQNNGTTRSNRGGQAASDIATGEEGVQRIKEEGGRHTPFHNKASPEGAAGIDGLNGHRGVGGYRAPDTPPAPLAQAADGRVSGSTNDYSGGGSRAQDHNSSRSNKTASGAAPEGGGTGNGPGDTGPDGKLTPAELEAQKHTKSGHVTLLK